MNGKRPPWEKLILAASLVLNLGLLFTFKYLNFAASNLRYFLSKLGITMAQRTFDIVLPVGISFYIFQALGYSMDVYRGEIEPERNFFKYALFVSFFPQLVAGPIERSGNLLRQMDKPTYFEADNAKNGLLIMAYGLFLKVVAADNIAGFVDPIFTNYADYNGMHLMLATVLFAFQIYCDFEGYSQIAIGCARVLGYRLNPNFNTPYLASSVKNFWNRWHISLTTWFRDYLYIPLGGNRKGRARKWLNNMIVFLLSGLWHGAAWHYVAWGGLNGLYLVGGDMTRSLRQNLRERLKINAGARAWKLLSGLVTFMLVDISWLFFRAESLTVALRMGRKMAAELRPAYILSEGFWSVFGSPYGLLLVALPLAVVFAIDICRHKNIDLKACIFRQQPVFRWGLYFAIILSILFMGAYGEGYEQTQFIYFQF